MSQNIYGLGNIFSFLTSNGLLSISHVLIGSSSWFCFSLFVRFLFGYFCMACLDDTHVRYGSVWTLKCLHGYLT